MSLLIAGFVIRPELEVAQFVAETLEQAVTSAFGEMRAHDNIDDLTDVLAYSPDERFRLRCFLGDQERRLIGQELSTEIVPRLVTWANDTFPNEEDDSTILSLGLEEFAQELEKIKSRVLEIIVNRIKVACDCAPDAAYPETFAFETPNRPDFIQRLKHFLSVEDGSVSPAVEKARVRGKLRSEIIPPNLENCRG
jgi:hypothetical protein